MLVGILIGVIVGANISLMIYALLAANKQKAR